MKAFFVTIPHSGEQIPTVCDWLRGLPEKVLMCDVDRYVDRLYVDNLINRQIPVITTDWHRYAADLNRIPADVDCDSVQGSVNKSGSFNRGFHWVETTHGQRLMPAPMSLELHQKLVKQVYEPFHQSIQNQYQKMFSQGESKVYHLDAHSMPSLGTKMHRDPGEKRADIVVSDCQGRSCEKRFVDLAIAAYVRAGFKVAYNWPYLGGRVSEQYGLPEKGQHALQVELNRALYMDEETKAWLPLKGDKVKMQIDQALTYILENL